MKVLFLTNVQTPYRVDFFNELGKYCDLTVLYERENASDRDKAWKSDSASTYKSILLKGKTYKSDSSICFNVVKWLKKDKYDIFVIGGYSTPTGMIAIQTLKFRKIPFILSSDGGFIKNDKRVKYLIKKYFISSANWWLSTGQMTNQYLKHYGAKENDIFIYPFTSIKEEFINKYILCKAEKQNLRNKLNIDYDKIAISVGQFIYRKGYDLLIKHWAKMDKDWCLLIIGSGESKQELEELIKKYNLKNIKLIGFKQKEDLREFYLASDIFILPTREDIWGLVINEAIAYGLPVITTDKCIAGKELIIPGVTGEIISLDNLEQIDSIVKELYNKKTITMENTIRKKALQYTIEKMAYRHIEIFEKILR